MPMFSGEAHAAELAPLQDGPRPGKAAQGIIDGFPIGRDKILIRETPLFEMIVHRLKNRRLRRAKSVAELSLLGHRDPPILSLCLPLTGERRSGLIQPATRT